MLTLRTLRGEDSIEELTYLLHRAYALLGSMGLNYTAVDQAPEVTAKRLAGGYCFLAEWTGVVAGTIVVQPTYAHNECWYFTRHGVASIHQFGVDPMFQGKGIGRALLEQCEHWAKANGYTELAMDTAESANHLLHMYYRRGYSEVGYVQWPGKTYRSVVLSKMLQGA